MNIRPHFPVNSHTRKRLHDEEFKAIHSELFEAHERDRLFEARLMVMLKEIETALAKELA